MMRFFKMLNDKLKSGFQMPVFSKVKTIPEGDIALLAIMCKMCAPEVKKANILGKRFYAYYATQQESDIQIAQEIFVRNGINMSVHNSYIFGSYKEPVLRVNYALCDNDYKLNQEMRKIEQKYYSLYTPDFKSEKAKLYQQLLELRQHQK